MSKLNSIDNYEKPFPSTLRKLIERKKTTIKAVADYIGVSRQAVSQYQDGSTQPNADTIVKIAEFFGVSTDYLLTGKSKHIDESFNIACDITGLSSTAIRKIVDWKNTDDFHRFWSDYISSIIESDSFENLLLNIGQILGFSEWEVKSANKGDITSAINFIDMQTARLWYISKTFTDIIEDMCLTERLKGSEK
jgi:transcriptional regulator with XRE-family HTH domain